MKTLRIVLFFALIAIGFVAGFGTDAGMDRAITRVPQRTRPRAITARCIELPLRQARRLPDLRHEAGAG